MYIQTYIYTYSTMYTILIHNLKHTHTHTCTHSYTHVHIHSEIHIPMHTYTNTHGDAHTYVWIYILKLTIPDRWTRPHVTYSNWALFCAVSVSVSDSASVQFQCSLSEPLPRTVIFLIVKLRRGFSQLSFEYVLFAFNIFLIAYFCVVSSFEPPLTITHI